MNLYLRLLFTLFKMWRVPRRAILEKSHLNLRVWLNDCDFNLHLNNGRYLTFMDLGRVHLLAQCGLFRGLWDKRWSPVLGAAEISYIRPLQPMQRFDLVTRLVTWDEKYFYIEQRFEVAGKLHAQALVKGLFMGRGKKIDSAEVIALMGQPMDAPPMPPEIKTWNDLLNIKKRGLGLP